MLKITRKTIFNNYSLKIEDKYCLVVILKANKYYEKLFYYLFFYIDF